MNEQANRAVDSSLLSVSDLGVRLDNNFVLEGITFSVRRGSWLGVIGPNGSGKTTLLRTLNGFLSYTGSIILDGKNISEWTRRRLAKRMAFVRQSHSLAFQFRVDELVHMGKTAYKTWLEPANRSDELEVTSALSRVNLEGFARRSVLSLSGGELQRVFLAQALVQDTDLLLLDEPTTHLDVLHQFEFLDHVRELVSEGRVVVSVFHDLEQAARCCDLLLVLDQGRQAAFDRPESVLRQELIRDVFGMDARVARLSDGRTTITYLSPVRSTGPAYQNT